MGASSGQMQAASSGIQGIASIGSAYSQASATQAQGQYQKQMYDMNAELSEYQATDAINRGDKQAANVEMKTRGIVGEQRAEMGNSGVDVNTGSAAAVQTDSERMGAMDALTAKNNAWREAWGYKVQANNSSSQGTMAELTANNMATSTLVTGGMRALGYGVGAFGSKKG